MILWSCIPHYHETPLDERTALHLIGHLGLILKTKSHLFVSAFESFITKNTSTDAENDVKQIKMDGIILIIKTIFISNLKGDLSDKIDSHVAIIVLLIDIIYEDLVNNPSNAFVKRTMARFQITPNDFIELVQGMNEIK